LKDEPKPSFNQVPLFVSHTLTSDRLGYLTLEFAMNIELDEVVGQDVSGDALELAAGGWTAYAQVSWLNLQTHCVA
jgi:hypothetical protein